MPQPYIYVYQTICNVNGKSYVGVHKTKRLDDGYIGCGIYKQGDAKLNLLFHRAVKKYGYSSFDKYILSFYDNYEDALEEEKFVVNDNWVKNKTTYNSAIGGRGNTTTWMSDENKKIWKDKIKNSVKEWVNNGGLEIIRQKSKTAKRTRMYGSKNPRYGKGNPELERKVIQYDKNGNKLKEFNTLTDAAKCIGVYISSISNCCIGKNLTSKGFVFRYVKYSDSEKIKLENNIVRNKRIYLPRIGYSHSEETKKKISLSTKGRKHSEEAKLKVSIANKGRIVNHTKETREKISNSLFGRKLSDEHKIMLSKNNAKYWLGKKKPMEVIEKTALKNSGKKRSAEQKLRMSLSHKGKPSNNRKSIIMFDTNGNFIKKYSSIYDASIDIPCLRTSISNNLAGRTKKCNDFVFKYDVSI